MTLSLAPRRTLALAGLVALSLALAGCAADERESTGGDGTTGAGSTGIGGCDDHGPGAGTTGGAEPDAAANADTPGAADGASGREECVDYNTGIAGADGDDEGDTGASE